MSSAREIRCPAPHPKVEGWICNARLFDAIPETVELLEGENPPPGCTAHECPRCHRKYVACARRVA